MEKLSKNIHNHTFTDLLKVCVFALLLLLPGIMFLPSCLYYGFNEHATNTETTTINYKYQSNEVDNRVDNLIQGNVYHFNIENDLLSNNLLFNINTSYLSIYFVNIEQYDFTNLSFDFDDNILSSYQSNGLISLSIDFYYDSTAFQFYLIENEVNDYFFSYTTELNSTFTLIGDFIYVESSEIDFDNENFVTQSTYNVIESVDITNTNVMDSFVNNFNNTIDKHFNMGNVFNLTGVYDWFNTNIFNGNAPQVIYSVWNIALYELVMDLLFLLYGLFMWFIDMVQYLMDKPFKSIK